jgi:hypothetical protein
MDKFELEGKLKEEIRARVLGEGFMKVVQSVRRNGKQFKISLRPVEIGGERKFQAEMNDDGHVQVKNLSVNAAAQGLEEIIAQRGARDLHLITSKGDLHVRVTRKGRVQVSRSAQMDRVVSVQGHDRVKKLPLTSFDSTALLKALGIADGEGKIKAGMRGKYDQVNEFLKVVKDTLAGFEPSNERPFTVVDCGCGKAYLTVSLYFYLLHSLGFEQVRVIGIDRRLDARLEEGMVEEIRGLIDGTHPALAPDHRPIPSEDLIYYGLEYKFVTLYIIGELTFEQMRTQLATAIHQFAKRQMTWFRGMERKGIKIHWTEV